jgi:(1->4)-alpha-D-glucan 1-alpha-D-glucosylmutase
VWNALSQVLLKTTAPGVPDFYQGSELWNQTLVDPDNRGPVDFSRRRELLDQLDRVTGDAPSSFVDRMVQNPGDGLIKLYITSRVLRFRREDRELFARGTYLPLRAVGDRQRHVIAFARVFGGREVIVLAGRFFLGLGAARALPVGEPAWRDSALLVRAELRCPQYRDVLTQLSVKTQVRDGKSRLPLPQVFAHLPLALLIGERAR